MAQHDLGRFDWLLGQHHERAFHDDARLLGGDLLQTVAEPGLVVHGDRGDDRDGGVGDVRGVPGAAEPHLDDGDVDRGVGEDGERHAREHLEEGQPRASAGN